MMRIIKKSAFTLILLLPIASLAAPVGEHAGEILVDGPLDAQPGPEPSNPDAVIDRSGRSIFVWDGTVSDTRKEVFVRIFPADGGPPTDPVQVNTFIEENHPDECGGSIAGDLLQRDGAAGGERSDGL